MEDIKEDPADLKKISELGRKFLGWTERKTFCKLLDRVKVDLVKMASEEWRKAGYERTDTVKYYDTLAESADRLYRELCH